MVDIGVLHSTRFPSPLGELSAVASGKGLMTLEFSRRVPKLMHGRRVVRCDDDAILVATEQQLREYFEGRRQRFDLPLDLVGTPFQVVVWKSLAKIRFGSTISYAKEAEIIGRPTAIRAVGSANGRNPVPIVLPCHRVIASDGGLGGFSAGLPKKVWLLRHEREIAASAKKQPSPRLG